MGFFKILLFPLLFVTSDAFLGIDFFSDKKVLVKKLETKLIPLSKTIFKVIDLKTRRVKTVDLTGQDFIIVSVREKGSDGRFYAVDEDGTVWWSGAVTSGALKFRSPSGIFPIIQKKRYHMSNENPDDLGVNNMDYMLKFTHNGHALHKGSVDWMSHGCIHIAPKDIPVLYNWVNFKTKVLVTRESYMPFAKEDLSKVYAKGAAWYRGR